MKYIFLLLMLCTPSYSQTLDVKKDYIQNCKSCHKSAEEFFKGSFKTSNLFNTIKEMYVYQVGVNPSEKRLKAMYKYAHSLKKK